MESSVSHVRDCSCFSFRYTTSWVAPKVCSRSPIADTSHKTVISALFGIPSRFANPSMPFDGRKSPRAAIRDWLSRNDGYQRASTPRFNSHEDGKQQRKPRERHQSKAHTDVEKVPLQPCTIRSRTYQDTDGNRFQKRSGEPILPPVVESLYELG